MTDATAPTAAASEEAEERIELPVHVGGARRGRADGDERDLPEADLTCPAGEDHERDGDDRVDRHRGGQVGVLLARARTAARRGRATNDDAQRTERPLHLGQAHAARGGWAGRSPRSASSRWPGPRRAIRVLRRWRSSAPITITNMIGSTSVGGALVPDDRSSRPCRGRTAARKITVKFSIRPITAAVSARSRIDGPERGAEGQADDRLPAGSARSSPAAWRSPTRRCG